MQFISVAHIISLVIKMKDKIKELRKAAKYSQEELAKRLNVHQTAVSQWEQGRTTPDLDTVKKLANIFNVSTDYLLDNNGETDAAPITDNEIMFALFGGEKGITPEMYEEVKQFAEMVKLREKERKRREKDSE